MRINRQHKKPFTKAQCNAVRGKGSSAVRQVKGKGKKLWGTGKGWVPGDNSQPFVAPGAGPLKAKGPWVLSMPSFAQAGTWAQPQALGCLQVKAPEDPAKLCESQHCLLHHPSLSTRDYREIRRNPDLPFFLSKRHRNFAGKPCRQLFCSLGIAT